MALTKAQRRTVDEIEKVLRLGGCDWRVVEKLYEPSARLGQLQRMKLSFIRMKVIGDYIFADELLSVVIVAHFFPVENFPKRFKDKKMRTFMHFVMEELFMVRKLALVKEIRRFDREMAKMITGLNALRNAMAHSFVPQMKRDYRKTKSVTWNEKDLFTTDGLVQFDHDMVKLHDYLYQLAFGKTLAGVPGRLPQRNA